ncbi:MAG: T9SS type A sorting domain-containing protein [Paludibacteraceae bacterium]|nr:T9SS type A sorting domain-containing protein [Paludibacteraceae bacterium]
MRKKLLLLGLALASMAGVEAQSVTFKDLVVKPGDKAFIEFTISGVEEDWSHFSGLQFDIPVPEGVTPGDEKDLDFGGILKEGENYDPVFRLEDKEDPSYILVMLAGGDVTFKDLEDDEVTIRIPIEVAADAPEVTDFEMDLNIYNQAALFFVEDDSEYSFFEYGEVENGSITISASGKFYEGIVYAGPGDFEKKFFSDVAELKCTPNVLITFEEEVPADWTEVPNVVVKGKAKDIRLYNGFPYAYYGEPFVAEKVTFTYDITHYANKNGGWVSLAIPFDGKPEINPLTNATKENGKYWAKQFVGSTSEGLLFANLDEPKFLANQSYILAFPDASYGENEFTDTDLTIKGENVTVYSSESVTVKGTTAGPYVMKTTYDTGGSGSAYYLNSETNKFEQDEEVFEVSSFTAFALPTAPLGAPSLRSLAILDADRGLTFVESVAANAGVVVYANEGDIVISANESGVTSVYNFDGQLVKANVKYNEGETRIAGLSKGAYIVAGQAVILK